MASFPDTGARPSRFTRRLILSGPLLLWVLLAVSHAQLTMDGSLGPPGPLAGPHSHIGPELGQIRGGNLFHSFGAFNVPTGGSATFTGPNTIANILSRVTGGQPSAIDGVLRSEIAGANLYLLNPAGVLFGPNATLDVSGSFHVSTADFLRFADGAKSFATLGQESVLTVASPAAFGFLGTNPAGITMQGSTLRVPAGQTLSVVGGDVTLRGPASRPLSMLGVPTLEAPGGRIQLVSVASPGEVVFRPLELAPDLGVDRFTHLGRLEISQDARVDASGNGGGIVFLRSGRLQVDNSAVVADNTGPLDSMGLGLDLRVTADVVITNRARLMTDTRGGRARDLQLTAGSVYMDDSFISSTAASFTSDSGNITVTIATPTFPLENGGILTLTGGAAIENTVVDGRGGRMTITAPTVRLDNGRILTTTVYGGRGASLEVSAGNVTLLGGSRISSTTVLGGTGGAVTVTARDSVVIAGGRLPTGLISGSRRLVFPSGVTAITTFGGDAGAITITAPTVRLENGGLITTATLGEGRAGDLRVDAERLTLTGRALIDSSTTGPLTFSGGIADPFTIDLLERLGVDPSTFRAVVGSGPAASN